MVYSRLGHCRCPEEQSYELSRLGVTMAPESQVVLRAERSQSRPSLEGGRVREYTLVVIDASWSPIEGPEVEYLRYAGRIQ